MVNTMSSSPHLYIAEVCSNIQISRDTYEFLQWVATMRTKDMVAVIQNRGDVDVTEKIFNTWIELVSNHEKNPFRRGEMIEDLRRLKVCTMLDFNSVERLFIRLLLGSR